MMELFTEIVDGIERSQQISPGTCTLVEELSNSYDYFLMLSGFPDIFGKLF